MATVESAREVDRVSRLERLESILFEPLPAILRAGPYKRVSHILPIYTAAHLYPQRRTIREF